MEEYKAQAPLMHANTNSMYSDVDYSRNILIIQNYSQLFIIPKIVLVRIILSTTLHAIKLQVVIKRQ